MVGAVLVYQGRIIGEGFHREYGGSHAEINCLESVKASDRHLVGQSTLYVSLEPCNHQGKTPPCTQAIIDNGIKKVCIGIKDPNPRVSGNGIHALTEAGITTSMADQPEQFILQNAAFFTTSLFQRPYIILKWAQTRDGFIGKIGEPKKISGAVADVLVHAWRNEADALMVGTNTVIVDNPKLTTRLVRGNSPLRVILDRRDRISIDSEIYLDEHPTVTYSRGDRSHDGNKHFQKLACSESEELGFIAEDLWNTYNVQTMMVEGGAKLLTALIRSGLWDEARVITSGEVFDEGIKAPMLTGKKVRTERLGNDELQIIRNPNNEALLFGKLGN